MKQKYQNCAAIDIGSQNIFVAILGKDGFTTYGTTTVDFKSAADYLDSFEVNRVAMEATGVYWMALYDILEERGLKPTLVKAGDAKQLPGRDKTDGEDCQWLCHLFSVGLLRNSVVPQDNIRELRQYMRLRHDHIEMAAQHKQHIQKNMIMMNLRLPETISDITGLSGLKLIEAILAGERNAERLVDLCHTSIVVKKREQLLKALVGVYKNEYLFGLRQAYDGWKFYQQKIKECDKMISDWLENQNKNNPLPLDSNKLKKSRGANKLNISKVEEKVLILNGGIDVTRLPGISCNNALRLVAELGTDLTKWPTYKSFVKYLGLAGVKSDSGKSKKNKKRKIPKSGQIFKEVAHTLLSSTKTALGSFARRMRARKGPYIAVCATARKIAILYYNLFTKGIEYVEKGTQMYQEQFKQGEIQRLKKLAKKHGLVLSNLDVHQ
jgi:transposase